MTDDNDSNQIGLERSRDQVADLVALSGLHLDDDALWVAPDADLETSIMAAIADDARDPNVRSIVPHSRFRWLGPLVAVAAAAAIVFVFVVSTGQADPDWAVTLRGTEAAPDASAVVSGWNEESGTRVELDITGLEPAPDGFVYELWFSADEVHVSAGTFHGDGADAVLWAGVTRGDFPRVWITLEPLDDDPSPGVNILDTAALGG
jgi:hypothetical protein